MTFRTRTIAATLALASHLLAGVLAHWFHVHAEGSCGGECCTAHAHGEGHSPTEGHDHGADRKSPACGHSHRHKHSHDQAGHSHSHSHASHETPANDCTHPQQSPVHSEDECEICRYLALSVLAASPVTLPQLTGTSSIAVAVLPTAPVLEIPRMHLSRGPPLA